jgi:hypothetical protein
MARVKERGNILSRHLAHSRCGMPSVRVVEGVKDFVCRCAGTLVIHVVRDVVKVEEISYKIADDPNLRICCVWITLSGKKTAIETVIRFAFPAHKVTVLEEPLLRLLENLFQMSIAPKFEFAVRDQIR